MKSEGLDQSQTFSHPNRKQPPYPHSETALIDLHVHSTESDGTLSPKELVHLAWEQGLTAMALTDHDTVSGLPAARLEAKRLGLELVPGIELSTDYNGTEVHILGYYMDDENPAFFAEIRLFSCRKRTEESENGRKTAGMRFSHYL